MRLAAEGIYISRKQLMKCSTSASAQNKDLSVTNPKITQIFGQKTNNLQKASPKITRRI